MKKFLIPFLNALITLVFLSSCGTVNTKTVTVTVDDTQYKFAGGSLKKATDATGWYSEYQHNFRDISFDPAKKSLVIVDMMPVSKEKNFKDKTATVIPTTKVSNIALI